MGKVLFLSEVVTFREKLMVELAVCVLHMKDFLEMSHITRKMDKTKWVTGL